MVEEQEKEPFEYLNLVKITNSTNEYICPKFLHVSVLNLTSHVLGDHLEYEHRSTHILTA